MQLLLAAGLDDSKTGEIWVGEDMKDEVLPFLVPTEQLGHRAASVIYFL